MLLFISSLSYGQIINSVYGTGLPGYTGDGGPANAAKVEYPVAFAFDHSGNFYFYDAGNYVIRRVNTSGIISTVVGNGSFGYSGDGGAATAASISNVYSIAFNTAGDMFFIDGNNNVVREVHAGNISTIAGNGTSGHYIFPDPPLSTPLNFVNYPTSSEPGYAGIAVDASGNVYFTTPGDHLILKLTVSTNTLAFFNTTTNCPEGLAFDAAGNLYVADSFGGKVFKLNSSGSATLFAGNGGSHGGDGGPATAAGLNTPTSVAIDPCGNVYISEFTAMFVK